MDETSVKYEMSSLFCMDRAFERLMGYVDVDVYSFDGLQTYKEEAVNLAVPACKIHLLDDESKMMFESHKSAAKDKIKFAYQNALDTLVDHLATYGNQRRAIDATLSSMEVFFKKLQVSEMDLEKALSADPNSETEENQDKRENAMQQAAQIKRRMAANIRAEQRKVYNKATNNLKGALSSVEAVGS